MAYYISHNLPVSFVVVFWAARRMPFAFLNDLKKKVRKDSGLPVLPLNETTLFFCLFKTISL